MSDYEDREEKITWEDRNGVYLKAIRYLGSGWCSNISSLQANDLMPALHWKDGSERDYYDSLRLEKSRWRMYKQKEIGRENLKQHEWEKHNEIQ